MPTSHFCANSQMTFVLSCFFLRFTNLWRMLGFVSTICYVVTGGGGGGSSSSSAKVDSNAKVVDKAKRFVGCCPSSSAALCCCRWRDRPGENYRVAYQVRDKYLPHGSRWMDTAMMVDRCVSLPCCALCAAAFMQVKCGTVLVVDTARRARTT